MGLITSPRLEFVKLSEDHFEDFCSMDMDPEVMRFYTSRSYGTREAALLNFEKYQEYMKSFPQLGGFAAFNKDDRRFIGLGVLIHLELNPSSAAFEVGYRLPKASWGQGYATEICKALIDYGFKTLGLKEILGTTHPDHIVSQRVLQKCGLKFFGSSSNYGGCTVFKISAS